MIIIPPDELAMFIAIDEEGNWIHDPNMPKELDEMFEKFVSEAKAAKEAAIGYMSNK